MAKLILYVSALLLAVASIQGELYNWKTGNKELSAALSAALNDLESEGELGYIYDVNIGGPNIRLEDCPVFRFPFWGINTSYPVPTPKGTLAQVLLRRVLRVGYWDFHESWQLALNKEGVPSSGFLFDLIKALVEKLECYYDVGLEIQWVHADSFYPDLLEELQRASTDIVVSQISKTQMWGGVPRQEVVDFTCSFATDSLAFAVSLALKDQNLRVVDDFNKPAYTLAVVKGTSSADFAHNHLFLAKVVEYDNVFQATWAVHRNEASAVLEDQVALLRAVKQYPRALFFGNYGVLEGQGIATRKDDDCGTLCKYPHKKPVM